MATISKENLAQFWLNAFPLYSNFENLSFSDTNIVKNLLELTSDKNDEKKIFNIINHSIQETKSTQILKSIPKRQRPVKNNLSNIDSNRLRFKVHVEVIENADYEEEIPTKIEGRKTLRPRKKLSSIFRSYNRKSIVNTK